MKTFSKFLLGIGLGFAVVSGLWWLVAENGEGEIVTKPAMETVQGQDTGVEDNREGKEDKPQKGIQGAVGSTSRSEDSDTVDEFDTPPVKNRSSFWQPFLTRQSAEGFIGNLCFQAGVCCGVEKLQEGGYRIYFEYIDEADRQEKLALLRETSGFTSLLEENKSD